MREYATPLRATVVCKGNLTDDVVRNAETRPEAVAFSRRSDGAWSPVTSRTFLEEVRSVARGLVAAGLAPGDRVGLLSCTRYEWTLVDYAIWFAGAVTVPLYESSGPEELAWVLRDSGASALVVENAEHLERLERVRATLPALERVWCLDRGALAELGEAGSAVDDATLEERRTTAGPGDLATLVYTSGTTGRPKGCMLTHGNFMVELTVAVEDLGALFEGEDAATLVFLPLAHVFARVVQVGAVRAGVRLGHSPGVHRLVEDLHDFEPSFVLAVPRVFEKVFNQASLRAVADGRGQVFDRAVEAAIDWSRQQERGRTTLRARARHALYDRAVYARLRAALGGRCTFAISGGAPLGERLAHFYRGMGLSVLEGYGLSESTAALAANLPGEHKVGTVGRPLQGTEVRVAEDGELLFRGGQVFVGYWGDEHATAEALDAEGWLHTGDVGEIDEEGFVRVTGRKREILVTAGGKSLSPTLLEDRLRAHPLIDQALVVGDGRAFVAAVLTLDEDTALPWAAQHGKRADLTHLADDEQLREQLQTAVDQANASVSRAESVRRFVVLPRRWSEETGQLTPSLKLKRSVVLRECRDVVDALYEHRPA